jgi:FixJ family two-component response regulator
MNAPSVHFYIVDDDLSFGKSLKRLLNARGIAAENFGSAQCFLDSVPPSQRGCAIVDIHMPVCDGFALMDKMRDLHYRMPVIIITGQTYANTRDLAFQNGAVGFLQKPFSAESLLELVNQATDDSSQ